MSQEHRARIDPAAGVEAGRTGLVVDNHPAGAVVDILHAADAVPSHHNLPGAVAAHRTGLAEARRTAAVVDNHPPAAHKGRAVVEELRRTVVVGEHRSLMRRSGRSSLAVVEERRRIAAGVGSRLVVDSHHRRSCRSSRLRTW